jgi:hypothetical protein
LPCSSLLGLFLSNEEKCYITLTPGANDIKIFITEIYKWTKKISACPWHASPAQSNIDCQDQKLPKTEHLSDTPILCRILTSPQILEQAGEACHAQAYLVSSSVTRKKVFITFTNWANDIKLFITEIYKMTKKISACPWQASPAESNMGW